MADMASIQTNKVRMQKLSSMPAVGGYKFYDKALRNGVLTPETTLKLCSLTSKTDSKTETRTYEFDKFEIGEFCEDNCSFTAPKAPELLDLLGRSSKNRKAIICFNSQNWHNASDGILVQFSDGEVAEYFDYDSINDLYPDRISLKDWDNGQQGTIIGKVAPFDRTFD